MWILLRFWLLNAIFLGVGIVVLRTTYSRLGGELDVKYTYREALSVLVASLAFTLIFNAPSIAEGAGPGLPSVVGFALFVPGCIAMMFVYRVTHVVEIEGGEAGFIGLVFAGLHALTWLLAMSFSGR
jgi:membrane protein CcdC involved in cytochrome C biogenesis